MQACGRAGQCIREMHSESSLCISCFYTPYVGEKRESV